VSVDELKLPEDTTKRVKGIRTIIELSEKDWDLINKKVQTLQGEFYEARDFKGLLIAPQTEQEAIILFSKLSEHLGMRIISVGTRFPDAYIQVKNRKGNWVGKSAEFELVTSNFEKHGHIKDLEKNPGKCDMVICWENNGDLPNELEVVELKSKVKEFL